MGFVRRAAGYGSVWKGGHESRATLIKLIVSNDVALGADSGSMATCFNHILYVVKKVS